jgi:hypothetical protein
MRSADIQRHSVRRHPRLELTLFSRVTGQERREDIDELMHELRDVADALERAERKLAAIEALDGLDADEVRRATTHVRFLSSPEGYTVVEADEPPPAIGEELEIEGAVYVVEGFRPSPFPADARRCAIVAPAGRSRDEHEPDPAPPPAPAA